MQKKKICLLIYNLGSGGAEHVISQWSYLLSEQFEVYMTVFDGETKPNYKYYGKLHNLDVRADNRNVFTKILRVLKRVYVLRKFVKNEKIDAVVSFCNECNLVNTLSRHGAKKICSIRSVSDISANVFVKHVINAKNNVLILQTEALKGILLEKYGEKIRRKLVVFGNPFDTMQIQTKAKEQPPEELRDILTNKTTIVNVASFKDSKNHENLLRSFELVCEKCPNVYLLLVGGDPIGKEKKIRAMVEKSDFKDQIIFVGEMKNPFSVVSRSTLFVLPSLAEGTPNALAEAMICDVPVVASNCPTGPLELLTDDNNSIEYNAKGYSICEYGVLVKPFKDNGPTNYEYSTENYYFANAIIDILQSGEMLNDVRKRVKRGAERFNLNEYKEDLNALIQTFM